VTRLYPDTELVLEIHAVQIARYGGSPGLRDAGQLDSALHRPRSGYYSDLIEEAAALWESLSQNHPFIDGNKRTALASTLIFLGLNDYTLSADNGTLQAFITGLYDSGEFQFERLEPWLREHAKPR
tara:strand:+ start:753 stop:1130 length:378 start_codon:yes stop_codon:yes gene_type:complete